MNALDVLRAGEAGRDNSQSMFDQFARQRAGNALAQGDYQGGANALLRAGQIGPGLQVQRAGEQQDEGGIQEAAEKLEFMGKAAGMLRRLPLEARAAAREQLMGTFQAMGLPPEVLQQIAQAELSDQNLDVFAGETEKARANIYQMRDGSLVRWDGQEATRVYEPPEDPLAEELARARIAATRAQEVQRRASAGASNARAAKTRSGGGGRGGSSRGGRVLGSTLPSGY
jgi:hypothetical protein